jgi:hypothetical protein
MTHQTHRFSSGADERRCGDAPIYDPAAPMAGVIKIIMFLGDKLKVRSHGWEAVTLREAHNK